ncbi:ALP1-like protein [Tanacetum coccineum]
MSYELFFGSPSDDEDEVNSELAFFTKACSSAIEASKPKRTRNQIERDRYGAHDRLVAAYFSNHPQYDEATFHMRKNWHFRIGEVYFRNSLNGVRHHYTDWAWENCPHAFKAQFSRGDNGSDPFILLEAIASQDLWIWHAFFGVFGMNNDVNALRESPKNRESTGCSICG